MFRAQCDHIVLPDAHMFYNRKSKAMTGNSHPQVSKTVTRCLQHLIDPEMKVACVWSDFSIRFLNVSQELARQTALDTFYYANDWWWRSHQITVKTNILLQLTMTYHDVWQSIRRASHTQRPKLDNKPWRQKPCRRQPPATDQCSRTRYQHATSFDDTPGTGRHGGYLDDRNLEW